jgi:hypothetical protein
MLTIRQRNTSAHITLLTISQLIAGLRIEHPTVGVAVTADQDEHLPLPLQHDQKSKAPAALLSEEYGALKRAAALLAAIKQATNYQHFSYTLNRALIEP